jgi:predicted nucleic acid-binding protein
LTADRAYVDSNVFFYAKILDRQYGSACRFILEQVEAKRLQAVTSVLVYLEVGNALRKYGLAPEVERVIGAMASLPMEVHQLDSTIIGEAVQISRSADISIYDCAHAATMKEAKVKRIVTADRDFERVPWITRLDPLDFVRL